MEPAVSLRCSLVPVLRQISPVLARPISWTPILILSTHALAFQAVSILTKSSSHPYVARARPSLSPWLDHSNNTCWGVQIMKLLTTQSSSVSCQLVPLYQGWRICGTRHSLLSLILFLSPDQRLYIVNICTNTYLLHTDCIWITVARAQLKPDGTRWRTGGEVKGKQANGVGSRYSCTLPRNVVYPTLLPAIKTYKLLSSTVSCDLSSKIRQFQHHCFHITFNTLGTGLLNCLNARSRG